MTSNLMSQCFDVTKFYYINIRYIHMHPQLNSGSGTGGGASETVDVDNMGIKCLCSVPCIDATSVASFCLRFRFAAPESHFKPLIPDILSLVLTR